MTLCAAAAAAAAKSLQLCLTLWDPIDGSPPGSPIPGPWDSPGKNTGVGCHFLQCMKVKSLSCVRFLVTPRTAAYQAPPFMGFSRQEDRSGLPLPSLKWLCMRDSKRDTDIKNRLLDSVGEGEGGMVWENRLETCMLPYVK